MSYLDLAIFALAGVFLKLADHLGETRPRAFISFAVATVSGIVIWWLMRTDANYSTLFLAIIVGSFFSRKVNTLNLAVGLAVIVALALVRGIESPLYMTLAVLAVAAFIDEFTHDRVHDGLAISSIIKYRPAMKVTATVSFFFGGLTAFSAASFLVFDFLYEATSKALEHRKLKALMISKGTASAGGVH